MRFPFAIDARRGRFRRLQWIFFGVLFGLVVTESIGHVYFRIRNGAFLWQKKGSLDVFRVPPFTEVVHDERVVTLKANVEVDEVRTDSNRFRVGAGSYEGKARDVVFLGDSVPFGWALPSDQTVPSDFGRLLDQNGMTTTGVINAAIPSYSLLQAVKRYEHELDEKFPISAVVLQVWDPVSQLVMHGRAWKPEMNSTTKGSTITVDEYLFLQRHRSILYSSLLYYALGAYHRLRVDGPSLSPDDMELKRRFIDQNHRILSELGSYLVKRNASLYLLPVNPAAGIRDNRAPVAAALDWLNESLRTYAAKAPRTYYVDVVARFDAVGRRGLFIDRCCHLSEAGAALQARIIYDEMSGHGDLPR